MFVIILAGILISMLTLLGLAVDSGTLYNAQLATQSAADAAVSSGAALLAQQSSSANIAAIYSAMRSMAETNLAVKEIPSNLIVTNQPRILVASGDVSMQLTTNVRLRIMNLIPGIGPLGTVSATARARVKPAVVSLLLDTSFSMCCPVSIGVCSPQPNCPLVGSKLEALQSAVISFLDHFDPARDSINLVPYSLGADLVVPFRPRGQGFSRAQIATEVQSLRAGGATNLSDAILKSYFDVRALGAENEVAYVVFSDGSPTAARFLLNSVTNPVRQLLKNNILGFSWSDYDYLSWSVVTGPPNDQLSVPYYFVFTPRDASIWHPRLHLDALPPPGAQVLVRGPFPPDTGAALFSYSLIQMDYFLPDGSVRGVGSGWDFANGIFDWSKFNYKTEYFNYPLLLADFARKQGGSWFTIGLGPPALNLLDPVTNRPDPYQNPEKDFDRKDVYLRRMANDSCGMVGGDPDFPGFDTYSTMSAFGYREGSYLATPSADELTSLFDRVARQIKLQMIE